MRPTEIIPVFDKFLTERKIEFEAVVIGGAALCLLGVITRETRDCDILSPEIPTSVMNAASDFAKTMNGIESTWLNNGPSSLLKNLPNDWSTRTESLFKGESLTLHTLGRSDLLKTKLFALCDRDIDLSDCIALKPSRVELLASIAWVKVQDGNTKWPDRVDLVFAHLAKRLGYEL